MSETNKTPKVVAEPKLTFNEKLTLVLILTLAGAGTAAVAILSHRIGAVNATNDNILTTLQDEGIIQNLKIGE